MAEMNGEEASRPKYTRGDLVTGIFLAALAGAWILAFAGILIMNGVGRG
jgi:hypothetical protein